MEATIVFEKNWDAIHAKDENGQPRYRYIINEGSSRSSKTHSIFQVLYLEGLQTFGDRISIWRDTKKDCKDTVLNDMLKCYRTYPNYSHVVYNRTESFFLFPHDSKIEIQGTDDPEKVHSFNGEIIWLNEPYKIGRETFDQLDMRTVRFVIIDWNPKKAHWIDDLKKDPRAIVIHSTFRDNPFCPPEQRVKILSYQPVKLSTVVLEGKISAIDAFDYDLKANKLFFTERELYELSRCIENEHKSTANEFNWMVYGLGQKAERPNRIFKWKKISDYEFDKLDVPSYIGVDWGAVDPWGIVQVKYYDGALYLKELNYTSENQIKQNLDPVELYEISQVKEGIVKWLFDKLGIDQSLTIICDDNRPQKIMALREAGWDYAMAAAKPKGSVLDGIDTLRSMPVYYTESSKNIEYEQENYSYEQDRYGIVLEDPEDADNHLMDPTRYVATYLKIQGIIKTI